MLLTTSDIVVNICITTIIVAVMLINTSGVYCDITVGYGVDIFRYWGDLGHFLKTDVQNVMLPVFEHPIANTRQLEVDGRSLLKGGFQVELCRDVPELLKAHFRSFFVERSKRPWKLFSAGWTKNKIGRRMGLNSTYLNGQYGFAFVRMSRYRQAVTLDPTVHNEQLVLAQLERNAQTVIPGDVHSVLEFFTTTGSHYVSSYVTGEALYQVFVYSMPTFIALQQRINVHGIDDLSTDEYIKFFSPWYAEHVGNIMVASENSVLEKWANNNFLLQMSIFTYPSLIKFHVDPTLSLQIDHLMGNNALLNIDMRTLEFVFKDYNKRFWFQQVLDNYLKLWEENG